MTVNHDVAGSSPAGGAKEKADRIRGLIFLFSAFGSSRHHGFFDTNTVRDTS